jgi:hypothetical protein
MDGIVSGKLIVAKGMEDASKYANKRKMDNFGGADVEMDSNWERTRKVAKVGKGNNILVNLLFIFCS